MCVSPSSRTSIFSKISYRSPPHPLCSRGPFVSTFIFDAEGTPCLAFDAEAHLEAPLTAFVAGDFTSPSGSTGPSLVYLDTGGKVVAYHGLLEQVRSVGHERALGFQSQRLAR